MLFAALIWIVTGFVVAAVVRTMISTREPMLFVTMLMVGVMSAVVGGLISTLIFGGPWNGVPLDVQSTRMWFGCLFAFVASGLGLWAYMFVTGRKTTV